MAAYYSSSEKLDSRQNSHQDDLHATIIIIAYIYAKSPIGFYRLFHGDKDDFIIKQGRETVEYLIKCLSDPPEIEQILKFDFTGMTSYLDYELTLQV